MIGWISCADSLPEENQKCLIAIRVCGYFEVEGAIYNGDDTWDGAWCSTRGKGKDYTVSAWMPFPDQIGFTLIETQARKNYEIPALL